MREATDQTMLFDPVGWRSAVRQEGDLFIIKEERDGELRLTVPCAAAKVNNERMIDGYLNQQIGLDTQWMVSFQKSRLTMVHRMDPGDHTDEAIDKALELIRKTIREFDLIPVCMHCDRTGAVTVCNDHDTLTTICGICNDERRLAEKKERITIKHNAPYEGGKVFGNLSKSGVKAAVLSGVYGGLIACVIGTLIVFLEKFCYITALIPFLYYFATHDYIFIATMAGGFVTMRHLLKMSSLKPGIRILIGNISALLVMTVLSLITYGILYLIYPHVTHLGEMTLSGWLGSSLPSYNLALGLPFFFVAETIYYFIHPR